MAPSRPDYIEPRKPSPLIFDDEGNIEGVRKLRYTPVAWEELDSGLTGDALLLLLLIRRVCDRDETDGRITERALKALAVEHGIGRKRLSSAIANLVRTEHLFQVPGALCDAHFAAVCFTANERSVRREQWKRAKATQRGRVVS